MDSRCMPLAAFLFPQTHKNDKLITSWCTRHRKHAKINCGYLAWDCKWQQKQKLSVQRCSMAKVKKDATEGNEEQVYVFEKKGTIAGAVALIVGTSIGSGILALPRKASPAGVIPSSASMIEALLLIEVNVGLRRKISKREDENELEVISISTMAQETLGHWGATLATATYVFFCYTSMTAYSSKSGEILFHLINLSEPVSACLFTAVFTLLISIGGTEITDQVNQWLTSIMIGLLLAFEVLAVVFEGWSGLEGSGDWGKVPATIPVMIFSLVYHDLIPVLCAYLGGDLKRLRVSVLLGSLVPLFALLVWDAVALGIASQADQTVDPVELLINVRWGGLSYMVEAFSLLAVGTSMIGTLLGFSEFFKEQLRKLSWRSPPSQLLQEPKENMGFRKWWGKNKLSFTAMAMIVAPTLLISTTVPDAFNAATDIAGGYCMTMLYGVLPPAMAWTMYNRDDRQILSRLLGIGIFACGILVQQILQDLSALYP
ncbi:hypothetical protein K2173_020558 [Erythroxylum novogranatense]|uniref:Tyrosine-specific transport protein n=1 Tax=Erythroxylum novogranatense TaxID=1862640 RepID=A0AAV8TGM8_9ROSI|nr:hypothetical protein K2173_020558 [Erythroxylum novogranatense]